jgi:hypothetical protein
MMLEYQELEVLAISTEKPPARREAKSSGTTVLHCPKESTTCQMMPALTEPMELPTNYTHPQEPAAVSMEPPPRREAQSSEPMGLYCSKKNMTYQVKPEITEPVKLPAKSLYPQKPAATSMERPACREAHSSEPTAPHCPKENMTCQMMPAPTMPMEVQIWELVRQEPAVTSMERPARREIHSSEPSALRCPKERTTCRMKPQEMAAISIELSARREAQSLKPMALHSS